MKNARHGLKMLGVVCLMGFVVTFSIAEGQGYKLFFLINQDFDSNIGGWFTCLENRADGGLMTHGTVEWSSKHGGSAHMTVSGAPSKIGLLAFSNTAIYPGDILMCRVTHTDFGNFANTSLMVGGHTGWTDFIEWGSGDQRPSGTYDISLTATHFYPPGTPVLIYLAAWPGSAEAWFHYVHLQRASGDG